MTWKPKRIAPPSMIAQQLVAAFSAIETSDKLNEEQRERYFNAAVKAFTQLMDGVRFDIQEDGTYKFPSRSRTGLPHYVNGKCDCESAVDQKKICWHRFAKKLIELTEQADRDANHTPPLAVEEQPAIHCPICAAPMIPALTPGGEECFECVNPQCRKALLAEVVEAFIA